MIFLPPPRGNVRGSLDDISVIKDAGASVARAMLTHKNKKSIITNTDPATNLRFRNYN